MSKRFTLKKLNERLAPLGYELVKGNGYFYFYPLTILIPELKDASSYTYKLTSMTMDQWEAELKYKIEESCFDEEKELVEKPHFRLIEK